MHVAAAFSLTYALSIFTALAGEAVVLGSLLVCFWRYFRRDPAVLGFEDGGTLLLGAGSLGERRVCLLPATTVTNVVVWVLWRDVETGRRGALMVLPDQMSSREWRAMQVWLRLKASRLQVDLDDATPEQP